MRRKYPWILEELVYLVVLALPTSIESLTDGLQVKMSNVFIGRASKNNIDLILSALFIGQTMHTLIAFPIAEGFGTYVNTLCSQAFGAKQYKQVGLYFYKALFMAALTCFPVFAIFSCASPIVYLLFQDWELARYTGSFTHILCFGYPAYLYYKIGIRFLQALNIVWGPVLYLIIGNILNGAIQYILIFQYNTTLSGAAAGYVIGNYLVALMVFMHIQLFHVHTFIAHKWTLEYIRNWLHTARYAIFPLFQNLVGVIPTTIMSIILIGIMSHDKRQLAIYTIIFSIWWVFSLGALGFSKAITVRVGQLLGANEPRKAKRSAILVIIIGQLMLILINIILYTVSEPLSHLFTTENSFAEELAWNIRMFSFLINADIKLVLEGVMNACCKQGIQMVSRFIFQLIIGNLFSILLVYFVSWKALAMMVCFSVTNILCILLSGIILSCNNWEKTASFIGNNITASSNSDNTSYLNRNMSTLCGYKLSLNVWILIRYLVCMFVGILVFSVSIVNYFAQ